MSAKNSLQKNVHAKCLQKGVCKKMCTGNVSRKQSAKKCAPVRQISRATPMYLDIGKERCTTAPHSFTTEAPSFTIEPRPLTTRAQSFTTIGNYQASLRGKYSRHGVEMVFPSWGWDGHFLTAIVFPKTQNSCFCMLRFSKKRDGTKSMTKPYL